MVDREVGKTGSTSSGRKYLNCYVMPSLGNTILLMIGHLTHSGYDPCLKERIYILQVYGQVAWFRIESSTRDAKNKTRSRLKKGLLIGYPSNNESFHS